MRIPRRRPTIAILSVAALAALPAYAAAGGGGKGGHGGGHHGGGHHGPVATTPTTPAPETIALPNGWQPEGIAAGPGGQLYAGSLATGAIYKADARTGQGSVLVPPQTGRVSQGLKVAGPLLVVAGGTTGHAYLYSAKTGANLADLTLTTGESQINDVALGRGGVWFTDSKQPQLYNVTLARSGHGAKGRHGKHDARDLARKLSARRGSKSKDVTAALKVTTLKITGDLQFDENQTTFEANGIEVLRDGSLLVIQSRTGKLFRVDPKTGVSKEVPLTGGDLVNGDGILLHAGRLYVVQNRLNKIAVVNLAKDASSATIERTITSPLFRVPTTVAAIGKSLFAVNARFGTPVTPDTDYDIVRVAAK